MFLFCASESTVEVNCGVRISGFYPVNALQVKGIHLVLEWPPNSPDGPRLALTKGAGEGLCCASLL